MFSAAVPLACALGAGAALVGLVLSYHLALPTGPTIAVAAVAEVVVAALTSWARSATRPGRASKAEVLNAVPTQA
jgi:ABC-type Mn2+/Zn2+ transport system permease subunit